MIFEKEHPNIDDNLLVLTRRFKHLIRKNPTVQWVPTRSTWVLTSEDYLSVPISIGYHWIVKNKYEIFAGDEVLGSFETIKSTIDFLTLMKFTEEGISDSIIVFLAENVKYQTVQEAANRILLETDIEVSARELRILGIDASQRGRAFGRTFGI